MSYSNGITTVLNHGLYSVVSENRDICRSLTSLVISPEPRKKTNTNKNKFGDIQLSRDRVTLPLSTKYFQHLDIENFIVSVRSGLSFEMSFLSRN